MSQSMQIYNRKIFYSPIAIHKILPKYLPAENLENRCFRVTVSEEIFLVVLIPPKRKERYCYRKLYFFIKSFYTSALTQKTENSKESFDNIN